MSALRTRSRTAVFAALALLGSGCAAITGSVTGKLATNLSTAILGQDDPETVRDGAPAYLLLIDALIEGSPDDRTLLLSGAQLYGAYAGAFVEDPVRRKRLADKAQGYGLRALCQMDRALCESVDGPFDEFAARLAKVGSSGVPTLYGFGAAWAGWVQAHSDDWVAVADIPKIEAVMQRVVALEDSYEDGGAHLYLGVLLTLRPASMGGKPDEGREHFERAIALSGGQNLIAKVYFADSYARLVFDRELHDRLCSEVLAADPHAPGLTLTNTIAREQAQVLLDGADDYF